MSQQQRNVDDASASTTEEDVVDTKEDEDEQTHRYIRAFDETAAMTERLRDMVNQRQVAFASVTIEKEPMFGEEEDDAQDIENDETKRMDRVEMYDFQIYGGKKPNVVAALQHLNDLAREASIDMDLNWYEWLGRSNMELHLFPRVSNKFQAITFDESKHSMHCRSKKFGCALLVARSLLCCQTNLRLQTTLFVNEIEVPATEMVAWMKELLELWQTVHNAQDKRWDESPLACVTILHVASWSHVLFWIAYTPRLHTLSILASPDERVDANTILDCPTMGNIENLFAQWKEMLWLDMLKQIQQHCPHVNTYLISQAMRWESIVHMLSHLPPTVDSICITADMWQGAIEHMVPFVTAGGLEKIQKLRIQVDNEFTLDEESPLALWYALNEHVPSLRQLVIKQQKPTTNESDVIPALLCDNQHLRVLVAPEMMAGVLRQFPDWMEPFLTNGYRCVLQTVVPFQPARSATDASAELMYQVEDNLYLQKQTNHVKDLHWQAACFLHVIVSTLEHHPLKRSLLEWIPMLYRMLYGYRWSKPADFMDRFLECRYVGLRQRLLY